MSEYTKMLLLFLFDATSIEVSVDDIVLGTGLTASQMRDAAVSELVEMIEWCSSAGLVRYGLTPAGRRAARALAA